MVENEERRIFPCIASSKDGIVRTRIDKISRLSGHSRKSARQVHESNSRSVAI